MEDEVGITPTSSITDKEIQFVYKSKEPLTVPSDAGVDSSLTKIYNQDIKKKKYPLDKYTNKVDLPQYPIKKEKMCVPELGEVKEIATEIQTAGSENTDGIQLDIEENDSNNSRPEGLNKDECIQVVHVENAHQDVVEENNVELHGDLTEEGVTVSQKVVPVEVKEEVDVFTKESDPDKEFEHTPNKTSDYSLEGDEVGSVELRENSTQVLIESSGEECVSISKDKSSDEVSLNQEGSDELLSVSLLSNNQVEDVEVLPDENDDNESLEENKRIDDPLPELENVSSRAVLMKLGAPIGEDGKNFQDEIIADWDNEAGSATPVINGFNDDHSIVLQEVPMPENMQEVVVVTMNSNTLVETANIVDSNNITVVDTNLDNLQNIEIPRMSTQMQKKVVGEIIHNESNLPPIAPAKDLFLAIELSKQGAQIDNLKKENEILNILESDSVADWREAVPRSDAKPHLDDLDISREIASTPVTKSVANSKTPKTTPIRKLPKRRVFLTPTGERDRETERILALQQLEHLFPEKQRRPKGTVAVAAADLERALASTPVIGGRKRRPCYLPESNQEVEGQQVPTPTGPVKSYIPVKRRSIESNDEIQTALQTIAVVNKHVNANQTEQNDNVKPKEAQKPLKKFKKRASDPQKKNYKELQQLLGDEGAVRMLYDAAHKDGTPDAKPIKKTKRELMQKTRFVQNEVMRLSGGTEKSLRGKRLGTTSSSVESTSPATEEPLFPSGTSSSPQPKPRKKPRPAEASRILYRHSSSESFDGSEGLRRSASEIAGLDQSPERGTSVDRSSLNSEPTQLRKSSRPRKVNSKFSEWITEAFPGSKPRRSEESRASLDSPQGSKMTDNKEGQRKKKIAEQRSTIEGTLTEAVGTPEKDGKSKKQLVPSGKHRSEVKVVGKGSLLEISLTSVGPNIKNGITPEVLSDLRTALMNADKKKECKAILLSSSGEPFCQGIDLALLGANYDVTRLIDEIKALVTLLTNLSKPLIAGVQGPCVGFGVALLPLCDVVIASDKATFFTPYTRLCQGLEGGASVTFPAIGIGLVSELVYKCSKLKAEDAARLGLVSQCVPHTSFDDEVKRTTGAICSQTDQALTSVKELMIQSRRTAILDGVARECEVLRKSWTSQDFLNAATEFIASGELLPNS